MRAGRAKPWPPTRGGGAAVAGDVGRRHKARGVVVEEAGASLPSDLEETGAVLVWKRRGESSEQHGNRSEKRTVRMRAQETKLAWVAHESERTGRSSRGCPNGRRRPDARALVWPIKKVLMSWM